MKIQLLWFPGCPHADEARQALARALAAEGLSPQVEEIDLSADNAPAELLRWGSPTILIDGRDVAGNAPGSSECESSCCAGQSATRRAASEPPGVVGPSCRIYPGGGDGEPTCGVPREAALRSAIREARRGSTERGAKVIRQ